MARDGFEPGEAERLEIRLRGVEGIEHAASSGEIHLELRECGQRRGEGVALGERIGDHRVAQLGVVVAEENHAARAADDADRQGIEIGRDDDRHIVRDPRLPQCSGARERSGCGRIPHEAGTEIELDSERADRAGFRDAGEDEQERSERTT